MTQTSAQQASPLMTVAVSRTHPAKRRQYLVATTTLLCGVAGTFLGTFLDTHTPADTLAYVFATLTILVAMHLLQNRRLDLEVASERPKLPSLSTLGKAVAIVGLATGFFGIGGGFLIVPTLRRLGFGMHQAVPLSLFVVLADSLVTLALRAHESAPPTWSFALLAVGSGLAALLSVKLTPRLGSAALTRAYALLLMALALCAAGTARGGHLALFLTW